MTKLAQAVQDADQAVARGELATARHFLEMAVELAPSSDLYLRLAGLARAMHGASEAVGFVDRALELEPLEFTALLMRASLLEQLGAPNVGEAYGRALAQQPATALPDVMMSALVHAKTIYARFQATTDDRLTRRLEALPIEPNKDEQRRVARFRTNVTRITKVFHSDPTHYHYPGLIEREFHDRSIFPWIADLEAATDDISREFEAVIRHERGQVTPYVQYPDGAPLRQWAALNGSRDWSAIHLLKNGSSVEDNARHCPITIEMLRSIPQPKIRGLSPNAMFSLLAPSTHIPAHTGVANTRLVCHLPLVVPADCWFRVGAETRSWRRGEAWVFDDTIEHEAMNGSDALRVVLIFDVWHPQLEEYERAAVTQIVTGIDAIDTSI